MSSGLLPDHIEPLVDRLRAGDHLPIALPDVAAVTEVLMRSLESYFKSIDLTLYKECQELADYIEDARSEISSLSPDGDDSAGIPRAGKELDAIVEATESATDSIMQAAEDLMSFETENFDEYKDHVNTEVMKIFEACSFQDITGQRISKVVGTLNHVEDRVGKLISILGITGANDAPKDAKPILDPESGEYVDEDLLNGPALAGEGIDQGEIDSLLNDDVAQTDREADIAEDQAVEAPQENAAETETVIAEEPTPEVEGNAADVSENVIEETAEPEGTEEFAAAPDTAKEVVAPEATEEVAETSEAVDVADDAVEAANNDDFGGSEETSQKDIDSLFG